MKLALSAVAVAVALAACGQQDHPAASAGEASGEAGGAVGRPVVPEPTAAPNVATGAARQPAAGSSANAAPAIARVAGPGAALGSRPPRSHTTATTTPRRDTGRVDRSPDTTRASTGSDTAAARDTTPAAGRSDTTAASGTVRVNEFMSYDKAKKTVDLEVYAAYDHSLGGFNFNGGFSGNQTITVPTGWMVHMHVVNKDAIPHSALIMKAQEPLPAIPTEVAIPRAYTTHLTDGLDPGGGSDNVPFKASPAGDYFLACGVPGHAASGMYIRFTVSDTASAPAYKM